MAVTTTGLILAAQGMSAAASGAQAYSQAAGYKAQGRYERSLSNFNAMQQEQAAASFEQAKDLEARRLMSSAKRLQGAQRTGVAGQNVDVSFGTPAAAIEETRALSALDALTIRNNAAREAMGFRGNAVAERLRGRMSEVAGRMNAGASLATGGMAMARNILAGAEAYRESPYLLEGQKPTAKDAEFIQSFGADPLKSRKGY